MLQSIAKAWTERRDEIDQSAKSLTEALQSMKREASGAESILDDKVLQSTFEQLKVNFDKHYGGFGPAPKFPRSHVLSFLLRYWHRKDDKEALEMVKETLKVMANGGLYDHIGGGFHRYSVDRQWQVSHFEKMIYDQAILARTYLEAYQITGDAFFAEVARETFDYVLRDMTHQEGGFYSAEDADSLPPKHWPEEIVRDGSHDKKSEGAFYLWTFEEIQKLLSKDIFSIAAIRYGLRSGGNVTNDSQGELEGKNVLFAVHSVEEMANTSNRPAAELKQMLAEARRKLFAERIKRERPHLDDKILADWNGLMISSLALGARVLEEPKYLKAAEYAAQFIMKQLYRKDGRLLHRYRDGESGLIGTLDDYAFLAYGLFDLYEATFNSLYLKESKRLTEEMISLFGDESAGGFFLTGTDHEKLLTRPKELYDGAVPSGNSIALLNLLRLGRLTMDKSFQAHAEKMLKTFSEQVNAQPTAYPQFLIALDFALGPSQEIVISGDFGAQETQEMIRVLNSRFMPSAVLALRPVEKKETAEVVSLVPFAKELIALDGKATAYVCENYTCKLPTNSVEKLKAMLEVPKPS